MLWSSSPKLGKQSRCLISLTQTERGDMGKFLRFSLLIIVMTVATRAYGQSGSGEQSNSQASTANATAKAVDLGQLNGGNYINNFFGLSLSVPQTWVDGSAQRRDAIAEETKRLLTTSDPAKRAQIEESI